LLQPRFGVVAVRLLLPSKVVQQKSAMLGNKSLQQVAGLTALPRYGSHKEALYQV